MIDKRSDNKFLGPSKFKVKYKFDEFYVIFPEIVVNGCMASEATKLARKKLKDVDIDKNFVEMSCNRLFSSEKEANEYEEYLWLLSSEDKKWRLSFK